MTARHAARHQHAHWVRVSQLKAYRASKLSPVLAAKQSLSPSTSQLCPQEQVPGPRDNMALKSSIRGTEVASSNSRVRPFVAARPCSSSRRSAAVVRAAEAEGSSTPPTLSWPQDTETARDIFAFAGSLPERLNGRMAMLGFAGIALTELQQQVPAAEQFANDVSGIALLSLTLTLASIFPKFVSGCSLKDLHASATSDNLRATTGIGQLLALFDTNTELLTGRTAMMGLVGLLAVEAFTGKVLF